jgi:hypothetical protein
MLDRIKILLMKMDLDPYPGCDPFLENEPARSGYGYYKIVLHVN